MSTAAQDGSTHNELSGEARVVAQFRDLHGPLYLIGANPASTTPRRARRLLEAAFNGSGAAHRRIGLWGPRNSGKTCFLTALNVAAAQAAPPWAMAGTNDWSREFLTNATATLLGHRSFPPATHTAMPHLYDWLLTAELPVERRRFFRKAVDLLRAEVNLTVLDVAGESLTPGHADPDVMAYLANCDGLVFFFDPLGSARYASEVVQSTLDRLEVLCGRTAGASEWRLPHRLAVCIAKADEPEVLAAARRAGLLTSIAGPAGRPVPAVRPADAERFFDHLCDNAPDGGGALIRHAIKRYFRPDRVRYFTTSSIGFYHDGTPDDLYNVITDAQLLRGPIRPVNVLEPVLWLQAAN